MNALLEAVARVDARAAAELQRPVRRGAAFDRRALLSVPPLVLLWTSALASVVLAGFTVPRLQAWHDALEAPPLEGAWRATLLAVASVAVAAALTFSQLRPSVPFRVRLVEALDQGRDGAAAVLAALGLEGPALVDGMVSQRVARALLRHLGPVLGATAAALLEQQRGVERGLRLLARRAGELESPRGPRVERVAAFVAAFANVTLTWLTYLHGVSP